MSINTITAEEVSRMFIAGALNLDASKEYINELNVFPVPDGDTGTNMTMTIMSAVDAVKALDSPDMESLGKAITGGSLRGARGNSGVILSQLCRGFSKVIKLHDEITTDLLADAADKAVETAYKAVMKPKEGTILTVARGVAKKVRALTEEDSDISLDDLIKKAIEYGNEVLDRTPDMLPVLKEAGVVDSGGKGLLVILEGAYEALNGTFNEELIEQHAAAGGGAAVSAGEAAEEADIRFGYCTEFIINLRSPLPEKEVHALKEYLNSIGDSIVLVADDEIVKIHVHTNDPGEAITKALTYGSLTNLKIDNMRFEHHERVIKNAEKKAKEQLEAEKAAAEAPAEPPKKYGFVSVCAGEGFSEIFSEMGVDRVISGGQTMNPSTEDFLAAMREINAETVFIFPNNGNIILAANQARNITKGKKVIVIPTKTVPQGISAMIAFDESADPEANEAAMTEQSGVVSTCQITYAIRDTSVDNFEIHKDDIMAVGDEGILAVGKDVNEVAREAVSRLVTEDSELISIYYGEGYSEEDAEALSEMLTEDHEDCDVEVAAGGQPVYYCILSVE